MSDVKIYDVKPDIAAQAHISAETYKTMYQRSIDEPEAFWAEQADQCVDANVGQRKSCCPTYINYLYSAS